MMGDQFVRGPPPISKIQESNADVNERREFLEYDADSETYRVSFGRETESVAMAVVSLVAVVSETDPLELPPFNPVCDPDALETVIQRTIHGTSNSDIHVTFTFADHAVTIHNYGIITVQPP